MSQHFTFTPDESGVARLTLTRPPANTLDVPMLLGMTEAVNAMAAKPPVKRARAILIASAVPGQFSAGVDPKAVLMTGVAGRKQIFLALAGFVEAVWFSGIPVVADVAGPALAGGAVLATLADFAIYDVNLGKISYSEVKVGLPLPLFVQKIIRTKINPASWNDVMLLGKNIDAHEAVKIGFATAVYKSAAERDELLQSVLGRVTRIAPDAMAATLKAGRAEDRALIEQFRADLGAFADFLTDDFLGKGLAAVVKGESPKF